MAKRASEQDDYDSPWKDALQLYLPTFLTFFFPDIHADIDWSRRWESLDKEFQKIVRRAKGPKRFADKLFKVWLNDGSELWLLIHIEVQGEYDANFPRRMFDYNVAAFQTYNQTVVGLAVLCDDRPHWQPTTFTYGRWDCKTELIFRIAKLLTYANDVAALEASTNPFGTVVLAHLKALETRGSPVDRKLWKFRLVKGLYRRNWSKEDVRQLFRLIDWIMTLPEDFEEAFRNDVYQFEEENQMEYMSSIERYGFKKGREEGREVGREEGVLEGIELDLDTKFGQPGRKLLPKVRSLGGLAELREFGRFLKTAKTLPEVRERLRSPQ